MSINELITQLNQLHLPQDQFAITASGPLAIRGLREAHDLDIIVSDELWENLKTQYAQYLVEEEKIILGNLEIIGKHLRADNEIYATAQEQIEQVEIINNLPFVKLEFIKAYKQKLDREKDREDVILIENYFNSIDTI